jgi:PAT family beta-lactamase induction signal transducer AmpG
VVSVASLLFVMQAHLGHDVSFLFISMGVESFVCGMSQVALITYLSHLTGAQHVALHYAILSSFASLMRVCFSSLAGWLADQFSWSQFYILVCISCIPSLVILLICTKHFKVLDRQRSSSIMEHV